MEELKPTKSSLPRNQDLKTCTRVFVRVDRVKKATTRRTIYSYRESEKYFTLLLKDKPVNISVDKLKLAHLLVTDSIPDKPTIPCKPSDEISAANDSNLLYMMISQLLLDMVDR
ncbi:hypothetical protein NPIL_320781 [Nephila pilipes]|uniref:Uncharacterized protein n=1 Tax=Nephila pilipes TaxID=299642 RepID=A0A8X6TGH3_NEPPI|nr:hypothetical protein NPIL_320781 [Nephila pilipes]